MKFTTMASTLILFLICFSAYAAEDQSHQEISQFLAPNEKILALAQADLNLDGRMDYVVILERTDRDASAYPDDQRPLLILIRNPDGSLAVAKRNDHAVYCSACGGGGIGDPFEGLEATRGGFTIKFLGGDAERWMEEYSFRYSKRYNSWQLVNFFQGSYRSDRPAEVQKWHNYKPPKDYGLIDIEKFNLRMCLKGGCIQGIAE
jgi:hypothetical protein